jgi:hypothetical protein
MNHFHLTSFILICEKSEVDIMIGKDNKRGIVERSAIFYGDVLPDGRREITLYEQSGIDYQDGMDQHIGNI